MNKPKVLIVLGFVFVAAIVRALPFMPPNFAPIGAMALFGGAYFVDKRLAFLLPLAVMLASDLMLDFLYSIGLRAFSGLHSEIIFVYIGFLAIAGIGRLLQQRLNIVTIAAATISSSLVFFLISNFGSYLSMNEYQGWQGLLQCYVAAIPFFRNTFFGDLFYVTLLFGCFELLKYRFPRIVFAKA
ncbi:MAG: DUF6580 family putative transport protein [Chitinophagales bacterium]|nr:DUF6580 family putative transport protein [Chitinophagales bacterium]